MPINCPLCNHDRTRQIFVKDKVPYHDCAACRFRFATPQRNPNLANSLADFEDCYLQYLGEDPADDVNHQSLRRWIERFRNLDNAELLDVGCGGGKFVRRLREQGVSAWGLEPCEALYEHFLERDRHFFCGELREMEEQQGPRFDVITALDVLEHVERPDDFLRDISRRLKPNGVAFISTPDLGSAAARMLGRRWHFYCPYHLSYFNRRTLAAAAAKHGLSETHFSRRGRWRSAGYVGRYAFEFLLRWRAPKLLGVLDRLYFPINLFDTMYVCLTKSPIKTAEYRELTAASAEPDHDHHSDWEATR